MTPAEIENRLDDAFRTLHGGRRSIDRHRTLEAALEWSYEALDERERLLFDRLAVFAGSCDIDAAEAVCADDDLIDVADVADLLDQLVSKSLIVTERTLWGTTRYRLLEPLRQFAEDRLSRRGQQPATKSRHLAHYTRWAEAWNADVWGAGTQLLERLDADFANLRSAVHWASEIADADKALRLVQGMGAAQFGWERLEVGEWGGRVLDLEDVHTHPLGPYVAALVASTQWFHGDADNYAAYIDRAEAMTTSDPSAYQPTAIRAIFTTQIHNDMHTSKALFDRIEPTNAYERTMLAFARVQMTIEIDGRDIVNETLAQLRLDAEATGSTLIGILANGCDSWVCLMRFEFDAALASAHAAADDALSIGAQFLAHFYLFPLGLSAAAAGVVAPRDLELMRNGLREQREAGNVTDQWQLLVGAVAALGDSRLAAKIHRGLQTSVWGNSRIASILPLYFPEIPNKPDATGNPPTVAELVDDVTAAIDHILNHR
jgi:hypothetical protein